MLSHLPSEFVTRPPGPAAARGPASLRRSAVFMDTTVTIEVGPVPDEPAAIDAIGRAFAWFGRIEAACSRFDPASDLRALTSSVGVRVPVAPLLLEPLAFALALAEETGGAFDPTVGAALQAAGFDRNYRDGARALGLVPAGATYLDLEVDRPTRTVILRRPLLLDLGAVAKGFAVDLAATELAAFDRVAVFAGGDVLVRSREAAAGPEAAPFSIGIQHPRDSGAVLAVLSLREGAVCTSGDYQRLTDAGHHILDPITRRPAIAAASVTVIAPTTMLADGLSTAAFALGPERGLELIEANGAEGMIVTPSLDCFTTAGFERYVA